MKLKLDFEEENKVEEVRKKQQQQEQEKILVNSIEPKPNHLLFEFHLSECGTYFEIYQKQWKVEKELVFKPNKQGLFELVKPKKEVVKIDLFDPYFKAEKKKYEMDFQNGVGYVTALNYTNAVKKFKELNPSYF